MRRRLVAHLQSRPDTGAQPLVSTDGKIILAVNGEIYNHIKLRSKLKQYKFKTHSDSPSAHPP